MIINIANESESEWSHDNFGIFFRSDHKELSEGVILVLAHSLQAIVIYCTMFIV